MNWIPSSFPSNTNYQIFTCYDSEGNDFMKLEGVDKEVCQHLLQDKTFSFWTNDHNQFTTCDSTNSILIALNNKSFVSESSSSASGSETGSGTGSEGTSDNNSEPNEPECSDADDCENGYCDKGQCVECMENQYPDGTTCIDKCTQNTDCGSSDRDYCDNDGHCQKCDEGTTYDSTYEDCFQVCTTPLHTCDDGTTKWCCPSDLACGKASGNKCMCETTDDCGENYNGYCDHITGRCIECTDDQYIEGTICINKCSSNEDCGTSGECNEAGHCVSSCDSNKYRDEDGTCRGCDDGTRYKPLSEYECQKCNITGKRVYYVDEGGYCQRSHCEKLKFESGSSCQLCGSLATTTPKNARECFFCDAFLASNGKCQPCSANAAVDAEEDNCNMCNDTDFPRQMLNGKCIPACISTQVACQNTAGTNFWCCPKGTECVPEDENVKCKVTSTEGKCRYQFSVTSGNGPYDIIMDDNYSCPEGQYCYGKWDVNGNFITGWVGDKTDKYIYGVCINMNHTIDSPAKDALNPWK